MSDDTPQTTPAPLFKASGAEVISGTDDGKFVTPKALQDASIIPSAGSNTGDETAARIGSLIAGATEKTTPVDADMVALMDSAASNVLKKLSWANIKATLKTYFDGLYPSGSGSSTGTNTGDSATPAETATTIGTLINAAGAKNPPIDADIVGYANSEAANIIVKSTWAQIKAFLKTYFDGLYTQAILKAAPSLDAISKPFLVAKDQVTLTIQANTYIKVINAGVHTIISFDAATDVVIATALDTGAIAAGLDYYVYVCDNGAVKVSLNSTYPSGYTAANSRKIGGVHTLCCAVGTISGHPLTDFAAGAILPNSVWCLNFRSRGQQEGHFYSPSTKKWCGIYGQSSTGATTASVYGAVITDIRVWNDHVYDLGQVGDRLLFDAEFQLMAKGSNQKTNIYGSNDPVSWGKCAPLLFAGSGLNDLSVNRTAYVPPVGAANEAQEYYFEIDGAATPDTVKWRKRNPAGTWSGYTTGVSLVGGITCDGIVFTWGATTGHTLAANWSVYVMNGMVDTANRRMISNEGAEAMCGAMYQWLQDQSYQFNIGIPTYASAGQTVTVSHVASPEGAQVYVKYGLDGTPYLCSNLVSTADVYLTFGSYKLAIKYDANANTGLPVYFQYNGTLPFRFLVNNTLYLKDTIAFSNDPNFMLFLKHDASAATNGVALYYDNVTHQRLECNCAADATQDLCSCGPTLGWQDAGNNEGSLYKQGTYGDVKLLAGGDWRDGSYCGSRCRNAAYYRWDASAYLGARGCAEPM